MRQLAAGEFFGTIDVRTQFDGFSTSLLRPEVPEERVERHTHQGAHFVFVIEGRYLTAAHRAPAACRAPLLIFNPAGTTHRDRFQGRGGQFLAVDVDDAMLHESAESAPSFPTTYFDPKRLHLAAALVEECRHWREGSPLAASALATELCASVGRDGKEGPNPPWVRAARDLLHDQCAADLRLADVAAAAGVHPAHLARVFRSRFGVTPGAYMRRCRIERASALLRDTRRDIARIALDCGFADQSHFTKAFRAAVGVPPGLYRSVRGRYSGR